MAKAGRMTVTVVTAINVIAKLKVSARQSGSDFFTAPPFCRLTGMRPIHFTINNARTKFKISPEAPFELHQKARHQLVHLPVPDLQPLRAVPDPRRDGLRRDAGASLNKRCTAQGVKADRHSLARRFAGGKRTWNYSKLRTYTPRKTQSVPRTFTSGSACAVWGGGHGPKPRGRAIRNLRVIEQ